MRNGDGSSAWACPVHGLTTKGSGSCSACGKQLYDVSNPDELSLLRSILVVHKARRTHLTRFAGGLVGVAVVLVVPLGWLDAMMPLRIVIGLISSTDALVFVGLLFGISFVANRVLERMQPLPVREMYARVWPHGRR